jgi:NAD-dependent deacetylase
MYGDGVEPNAAHEALANLERAGHLDTLLTQNVDGLHEAAGSSGVVRLHGRRDEVVCDDCGAREPAGTVVERVTDGAVPPTCDCGGVFKPAVVLFGEQLPAEPLDRAQRRARESDLFLAAGSSLSVRPASLLPRIAAESGATLAVVNLEETPVSELADFDVRRDVTEVLPRVIERL